MRALVLSLASLLASACSPASAPPPSEPASAPAQAAGIAIDSAFALPSAGGVDVAAGYLTMTNNGPDEDRLVSATSPRAERVELHTMSMEDNVMRMRPIEGGVALPPGAEIALAPGGDHLMFIGVTAPFAEGETIPVELRFERAGVLAVELPVQRGANGQHGH